MNRLPHPDNLRLQAAQGWLELGNHVVANEELDKITASLQSHPDVLMVRSMIVAKARIQAAQDWLELGNHLLANEELDKITASLQSHPEVLMVKSKILAKAEKWEDCLDLAREIIKAVPENSFGYIQRSFALHKLKRTRKAYDLLLPARDQFPGVWTIPYNLACYCAQLARLAEAQKWFTKAMQIDEARVKRIALDETDLEPLWDSLNGSVGEKIEFIFLLTDRDKIRASQSSPAQPALLKNGSIKRRLLGMQG